MSPKTKCSLLMCAFQIQNLDPYKDPEEDSRRVTAGLKSKLKKIQLINRPLQRFKKTRQLQEIVKAFANLDLEKKETLSEIFEKLLKEHPMERRVFILRLYNQAT